ncbi:MAG: superoxide dismutase, Ni [Pseudomonadota bacterium]
MNLFTAKPTLAHAHCDVPCGIYDPVEAQTQALSVTRFLDLLAEYEGAELGLADHARIARLVANKETHAAAVKDAVVVIWGDYFKPNHFADHPELHTLTHDIMQTASKCKQGLDPADGRKLVELINQFAEVFWRSKGVATETVTVPYEPKLDVVRPVAG